MSNLLWGNANPRRGLVYAKYAEPFLKDFPIGSYVIMDTQFDPWCWAHGMLPSISPQAQANHSCDEWTAHNQRRQKVLKGFFKTTTHPRVSTPYALVASKREPGEYIVRAASEEAMRGRLAIKFDRLTVTYRKQLEHLLQGPDYGKLPVEVRFLCEETYRGIGNFRRRVSLDATMLIENLEELRLRLEKLDHDNQLLLTSGEDANGSDDLDVEDDNGEDEDSDE
jgi:hypothetical protein